MSGTSEHKAPLRSLAEGLSRYRVQLRAYAAGLATTVPGLHELLRRGSGGTNSARYCYSVWMRHLVLAQRNGLVRSIPETVAELGPGDSIGIGLAALLCGSQRYLGLDATQYASLAGNLSVFEELVALFRQRATPPDQREFPEIKPIVEDCRFPGDLVTDRVLERSLAPERLAAIRSSIRNASSADSLVRYIAPWDSAAQIRAESVDFVLSQAVLEHVTDLASVYRCTYQWLKPGGVFSHQIDFRSHNTAAEWNGHWGYSDLSWRIIRGRRPFLLNREPCSRHLALLAEAGFDVRQRILHPAPRPGLSRGALAAPFSAMLTDEDLRTSGLFVQGSKPEPGSAA